MVCAYLVYSGMTAEEALQLYGYKRTTNDEGVRFSFVSFTSCARKCIFSIKAD